MAVFFVLSGFLITHLLLKEINRTSTVDLKKFYFRRTFRIFPPFYVFLAVVAILMAFAHLPVTWGHLAAAATYTWNYARLPENWPLGHCWSLALEEQFYLLWPASMVFFSKRTNLRIALGVVLLSPFSRVVTYYAWPSMRYHIDMMLHTHLDTIMMGCLLALAIDLGLGHKLREMCTRGWVPTVAIGFLWFVDTPAVEHWKGMYRMTVGFSLENVAIAAILIYSVSRYDSPLGRVLNLRAVKHVGMISYSLYLWQQLFTLHNTWRFPANIVVIFALAEVSYWMVERPSERQDSGAAFPQACRRQANASRKLPSSNRSMKYVIAVGLIALLNLARGYLPSCPDCEVCRNVGREGCADCLADSAVDF